METPKGDTWVSSQGVGKAGSPVTAARVTWQGHAHGVAAIDTAFPPVPMSAFLVIDRGEAAFIDTNTVAAVPR